jgi:hypothetical protein
MTIRIKKNDTITINELTNCLNQLCNVTFN